MESPTPPAGPPAVPVVVPLAGPAEIETYLKRSARRGWIFFALLAIAAVVIALVAAPGKPEALGVAAFVVAVTLVITLYSRSRLNKAWKGVVVRKEVREVRVDRKDDQVQRTETRYFIHMRTDVGRHVEIRVMPEAFARYFVEGDRLVKIRGLAFPLRTAGDAGVMGCGQCGAVMTPSEVLADGRGGPVVCRHCKCPIPDPARF